MRKRILLFAIIMFGIFHSITFSQSRFGEDSRYTDIIVQFQPTVLQIPEHVQEVMPQLATITVHELENLMMRHNVQSILRSFPDADPGDTVLVNEFGERLQLIDRTRIFRLRFPAGTNLEEVVKELQETPGVIFAETIPEYTFFTIPNDTHFQTRQWNLRHTGQHNQPPVNAAGRADIRASEAWDIYRGSQSIRIGIIDSGMRLTHEDLSSKVTGDAHTGNSHGTHVGGIASAMTHNSKGIAGVDWNARLISRNISGFDPEVIYDKIISALSAGSHVLNNSWGGASMGTLVRSAFATAYKMNSVLIASTGNSGENVIEYPAGLLNVIAVGASNHLNEQSWFSNYGNHIDVVAPGGYGDADERWDIYSTWGTSNTAYRYDWGTSMAAPHVSGLSSLLRGYAQDTLGTTLFNDDIRWIIRLSADKVGSHSYVNGWNNRLGYGRINAKKALDRLNPNLYTLTHSFVVGGTSQGASSGYWMSIYGAQALGLQDGNYWVRRHEVRRTISYSSTAGVAVWCRGTVTNGWANEPE
jgi:thermitase